MTRRRPFGVVAPDHETAQGFARRIVGLMPL